jgi:hypothetical protein
VTCGCDSHYRHVASRLPSPNDYVINVYQNITNIQSEYFVSSKKQSIQHPVPMPSQPLTKAQRMSYRIGRGEMGVLTFEPYVVVS